jgi:hypothetical protein
LDIICNTYQISISELIEAMRFDIEEGNFCDALLEKIGGEDSKKNNNSPLSPISMNNELDMLKKLQR